MISLNLKPCFGLIAGLLLTVGVMMLLMAAFAHNVGLGGIAVVLLGCAAAALSLGAADATANKFLPFVKIDQEFTVATVPSAASYKGCIIYVSNGDAGADCLARSDGTDWLKIPIGAAIAAS